MSGPDVCELDREVGNTSVTLFPVGRHSIGLYLSEALTRFFFFIGVQMCFEWFTKGQHDLESDVQQQLFKEKILKLEPYEITMNGECTENQIG